MHKNSTRIDLNLRKSIEQGFTLWYNENGTLYLHTDKEPFYMIDIRKLEAELWESADLPV